MTLPRPSTRMTSRGSLIVLVRHLTRATQMFDDFVDAPRDLASGTTPLWSGRLGPVRWSLKPTEMGRRFAQRGLDAPIDFGEILVVKPPSDVEAAGNGFFPKS